MKKTICAMAFAMAAGVPALVSAANIFEGEAYAYPLNGAAPTGWTGPAFECALINESVKLGVSKNVVGGLACDETNNLVQVAACHQGGSREQGVACSSDGDPLTAGTQLPAGCADTSGNSTVPSFKAFTLVSSGGVMGEMPLGTRCTAASLATIPWVQ